MILYHAISTYQVLEVLVMVSLDTANEEKILITRNVTKNRFGEHFKQIEAFFDDTISTEKDDSGEYWIDVVKNAGYDIREFRKIYAGCAHSWFGICLVEHSIPFIFMEDGVGAISRPEVLHHVNAGSRRDDRAWELGLYSGTASCIEACMYDGNNQIDNYSCENGIIFNVLTEFEKLSGIQKEKILNVFTTSRFNSESSDEVVFLSENFWGLSILSWEEQILAYKLVIDFFFPNKKLLIKTHPDDIMYYEKILNNCRVIREKFPSEIIPFVFDNRPQTLATISSTGIRAISSSFDNVISFDYDFSYYKKEFFKLFKIYTALSIYQQFYSSKDLFSVSVNVTVIDNFYKCRRLGSELITKVTNTCDVNSNIADKFIIIDDVQESEYSICDFLNSLDDGSVAIFLNCNHEFVFYETMQKNLWENIYPISIKLRSADNCGEEIIYAYSKKGLSMKPFDLKLNNMELDMEICCPDDKDRRIKILEGLLAASENRLKKYIEKERERDNESVN